VTVLQRRSVQRRLEAERHALERERLRVGFTRELERRGRRKGRLFLGDQCRPTHERHYWALLERKQPADCPSSKTNERRQHRRTSKLQHAYALPSGSLIFPLSERYSS
jgi:hypothetical protein